MKTNITSVIKVVKLLEDHPQGLWLREIARQLKMNPDTVKRALESIGDFVERRGVNEEMPMTLPNLPVYWKLKPSYNTAGILRFLKTTKRLKEIGK
ncbi:MAG: hypothetical protein HY361_01655 [Candidatus Aenigmarchaeota archaeon]|nr:hypothetical protein [Candidatus Aenigmarchaeota archaeon]